MMLRIPNPTAYRCSNCGEPAVLAEFSTGLNPVHCGTYRYECQPGRLLWGAPGPTSTVSDPP